MFDEKTFDTGLVRLNYAEGPETGPVLVLLHGGSASWKAFQTVLAPLAESWHIYAPDLRGHGRSGWTPGRYRVLDYAADIAAFLERGPVGTAVLFGHSLGGIVALVVAAHHPALVRAVIVGDSMFSLANIREHTDRQREMMAAWRELAGPGRPVADIARALKNLPIPMPGQAEPVPAAKVFGQDHSWFDFQAENLHRHDPAMLTAIMDDFDRTYDGYDLEELFPRITCPVLIIQGDPEQGGLLTGPEVTRSLALLPQARHVKLEGLGHALFMQQPQPVLEVISQARDWLLASGQS